MFQGSLKGLYNERVNSYHILLLKIEQKTNNSSAARHRALGRGQASMPSAGHGEGKGRFGPLLFNGWRGG